MSGKNENYEHENVKNSKEKNKEIIMSAKNRNHEKS